MTSKPDKSSKKSESKETIKSRFRYLNTFDAQRSLEFPPCCPIFLPEKSKSAPTILVSNRIEKKYKKFKAFEKEKCMPKPNIYLESVLCPCIVERLKCATNEYEVLNIFDDIMCKEFHNINERQIIANLLSSVFIFCKSEKYSDECVDVMLKIFYHTHKYLLSSLWLTSDDIYKYFKELVILHSVKNAARSVRLFSPIQGQKALLIFCKMYLRHLPLIRTLCVPLCTIDLEWPSLI